MSAEKSEIRAERTQAFQNWIEEVVRDAPDGAFIDFEYLTRAFVVDMDRWRMIMEEMYRDTGDSMVAIQKGAQGES